MKKILWVILAVSTLAACKKSVTSFSISITGKWELHRRYGGNIIPADTTYKAGNGNILQFNVDSTYKRYTNGTLTGSGVFHIIKRSGNSATNLPDEEIYFDSDTSFKFFITVVPGPILTMSPLMPDIGTQQYDKIANQ